MTIGEMQRFSVTLSQLKLNITFWFLCEIITALEIFSSHAIRRKKCYITAFGTGQSLKFDAECVPMCNSKQIEVCPRKTNFANYWHVPCDFHSMFNVNLANCRFSFVFIESWASNWDRYCKSHCFSRFNRWITATLLSISFGVRNCHLMLRC